MTIIDCLGTTILAESPELDGWRDPLTYAGRIARDLAEPVYLISSTGIRARCWRIEAVLGVGVEATRIEPSDLPPAVVAKALGI